MKINWDLFNIEQIAANSYKNFHAKGVDYLCFYRTPDLTQKFYFFDENVQFSPDVVSPHDHRYNFSSTCLAGELTNHVYDKASYRDGDMLDAHIFNRFDYMTPLNGGSGLLGEKKFGLKKFIQK